MPIHPRFAARSGADVEKAPLVEEVDDNAGFKDHAPRQSHIAALMKLLAIMALGTVGFMALQPLYGNTAIGLPWGTPAPLPQYIVEGMQQCENIRRAAPNPQRATEKRIKSDRYVPGTKPVWLKNGTVWTGEDDGKEVLHGADVWLENGVIKKIGSSDEMAALAAKKDADEVDLDGAWVTPGIVDMHSHLAVYAAPQLTGNSDGNSMKMAVQPWLRSLDGFNTHDAAFNLSIAGGITTMLVLPGSAGNIGGQAFTFKPRWTYENTPQSMQLEPPFVINHKGDGSWERTGAWRHIKHACGENPHRVYGNTRLDSAYDFRRAYNEGKKLKAAQDRWCESPKDQKEPFPDSLEWEVMADIIRGHVKVNIHCYETVDLNDMVRISNEFQFPIAAFHHAHEAYLVPNLLKQAYKEPPAVAIFANNARYKREAYRGSHFAAKVLNDAGIDVIMKSDHPVLDSRHLIYEAAQAHAFGVKWNSALASVTTRPAKIAGLDHRVGHIRPGYDADIVVWDSFPLAIGATPKQTYIDGIAQILKPHVAKKPAAAQKISPEGKYDKEIAEVLAARGDPDLRPKKSARALVFEGVQAIYLPGVTTQGEPGRVVVQDGNITCVGAHCVIAEGEFETIDLKGGSLAPGLTTTGSQLGLREIAQESMTSDGSAYDPLSRNGKLVNGLLVKGADGARFGGKDELMAYQEGVTTGVTAPEIGGEMFAGMFFSFSTSAPHALAKGAIGNPASALGLVLTSMGMGAKESSVSTKLAVLRRMLSAEGTEGNDELHEALQRAAKGELRLVVGTSSADIISALIRLKREHAPQLKLTILGGHEAWMVADDLAKEDIGVIVAPARSFPGTWEERRIMPGPPISNMTLPAYLTSRGVKTGLGIREECDARLTRFDAAWEYTAAPQVFGKQGALDLVTRNLHDLLGLTDGVNAQAVDTGFVAYEGDMFSFESRVRAVRAPGREEMDLF